MQTEQTAWDPSKLPPEVRALGRPVHTHAPAALLRAVDRAIDATRFNLRFHSAGIERVIFWVGAVFFLALVPVFLLMYFFVPITDAPQESALGMAGFGLLAGLASLVYALRSGRAQGPGQAIELKGGVRRPVAHRRSYFVYHDGLAVVQGEEWTVVRWDEIRELQSPTITGSSFQIVTRQGREVLIDQWVKDYGTLIQSVLDRVDELLLPPALEAVEAGRRVQFGPFGVSRRGLTYKGKKLPWKDVKSMWLQVWRGARLLRIRRRGGLFLWCWYDINRIPNDHVFYHVLCRTAPPHLLKEARGSKRKKSGSVDS
jgi:hypothetical protein